MKDCKYIVLFLKKQSTHLLAGFLGCAILVLLVGIVSQLQPPPTNTWSSKSGGTTIMYSTFVNQVNAGNVLAVSLQGNEAKALLQKPVSSLGALPPLSQRQRLQERTEITTWLHNLGPLNASWDTSASSLTIPADRQVSTTLPANGTSALIPLLLKQHVTVSTQPSATTSLWLGTLLKFAPLFFLLVLMTMALTQRQRLRLPQHMHEQMVQFTKQRIRRSDRAALQSEPNQSRQMHARQRKPLKSLGAISTAPFTPPTTFADVAGIDEVRVELEEIVQFLRTPEKFAHLGAHIPRGALLVGPPGTGKTLLARAVAGEAGVPFFSASASEFVEMFVGVGASRVRDLFQQARQVAPAVLFIDEIDAVGRKRALRAMGSEERDQTLNQLLVEMDGFHTNQAIVVLAATNRVDILDPALLRPGRFDRQITVSLPDRVGRQAILRIHSANMPLHETVSLERLARLTTGMSGADLANLANEAALCAARKNLDTVDATCFEEALARIQLGALRPLVMSETDRRTIAYHEGGHALVAYHLAESEAVNSVTILPRGQSLGVTQFIATEDHYNYSRDTLMAKIAVGLGGRAAEALILGRERVTTGAENDFQMVTKMARRMVTHWGMSEAFGVVFAGSDETRTSLQTHALNPSVCAQTLALDASGQGMLNGTPNLKRQHMSVMVAPVMSEASHLTQASLIDHEIRKILDEGYQMAQDILYQHLDQLQQLAKALLEHEQLNRAEFEELMQNGYIGTKIS